MFCKTWKLYEHKYLEIQLNFNDDLTRSGEWFDFQLATRTRQDHEGAVFLLDLLRLVYFGITFYDNRHYEEPRDKVTVGNTEYQTEEEFIAAELDAAEDDQWNHM
jgi:hypothetical protein